MTATEPAPALPDQDDVDATIKIVHDHADRIFLWNYDRSARPARDALQQGDELAVEQRDRARLGHRRRSRGPRRQEHPAAAAHRRRPRGRRLAHRLVGRQGADGARRRELQGAAQPVHARRAGRHDDRRQDRRDRSVDRRQVLRGHPDHGRGPPHRGLRQVPAHQAGRGVPDEPVPRGADHRAARGRAVGHRLPRHADRHREPGARRLRRRCCATPTSRCSRSCCAT